MTGASSGIGAALARELAARGHPLVLVARSRDALEALAAELPVPVRVVVADLATADGLQRTEEALAAADPPVQLLVNNAGSATHARLADQTARDLEAAVLVNVLAPTRLSAAALRSMPAGSGILNLSSTAAGVSEPEIGVYGASKAYVEVLSRATRREAAARGIQVTTVRPGWTRTAFHERSGEDVSAVPAAVWQRPEDVARAALAAYDAGRREVTIAPPDPRPLMRRLGSRLLRDIRSRIAER